MDNYRVALLLLLLAYSASGEPEAAARTGPPDEPFARLLKSAPYPKTNGTGPELRDGGGGGSGKNGDDQEQQASTSIMSRIASWILPSFGGGNNQVGDSGPAEAYNGGQYLPPPSGGHHAPSAPQQQDCNQCNNAPWVPMAANLGHKTIISFEPPHSSHLEGLNPPPAVYGAPRPPKQHFPPGPSGPPILPHPHPESLNPHSSSPSVEHIVIPPLPHIDPGPAPQYGPPTAQYGPPSPQHGPPPPQHGSSPPAQYGPPPSQYGQPFQYNGPPPPQKLHSHHRFPPNHASFNGRFPPPSISHRPQLPRPNSPPFFRQRRPIPKRPGDYNNIIDMRPPPVPHLPPTLPSNHQQGERPRPPPPVPSDSYGLPVTGDSAHYFSGEPIEQLPLESNFAFDRPIPVPNLSPGPVLPIHSYQPFREYNLNGGNGGQDVQVLPSINIADYLASIEHPINVVQSPLVELSVNDHSFDGYSGANTKLSEDPIFVEEDTHTEASHQENSIQTTVRPEYLQIPPFSSSSSLNYFEQKNNNAFSTTTTARPNLHYQHFSAPPQIREQTIKTAEKVPLSPPRPSNPIRDYSSWGPTTFYRNSTQVSTSLSTSMVPPPPPPPPPKKPKQIQIIIPYISENGAPNGPKGVPNPSNAYTTLLPVYSPPPESTPNNDAIWSKFLDDFNQAESKKVTATAFTPPPPSPYFFQPIQTKPQTPPAFDVISLHNHIDDWTQQEYSKSPRNYPQVKTNAKIPNNYFKFAGSAGVYSPGTSTSTSTSSPPQDHYVAAASHQSTSHKEPSLPRPSSDSDIESNLILSDFDDSDSNSDTITSTTTEPWSSTLTTLPTTETATTTTTKTASSAAWNGSTLKLSPVTREKLYIVTPLPLKAEKGGGKGVASPTANPVKAWSLPPKIWAGRNDGEQKFLIRVEPESRMSREMLQGNSSGPLTVVFSEWPHLINNLQTTTTKTPKPPTARHPLFGLMDVPAYTPPPNSTVSTISGHSKVVAVVTPSPKKLFG